MCLIKEDSIALQMEVTTPRSPWAKLLSKQIKPRLSRKVVSSTRVNLNKCWSKLGELLSNSSSRTALPSLKTAYPDPITVPFINNFYPVDPVKPDSVEENDNMENQNIINNRYELLLEDDEIIDNLANEERESNHKEAQGVESQQFRT